MPLREINEELGLRLIVLRTSGHFTIKELAAAISFFTYRTKRYIRHTFSRMNYHRPYATFLLASSPTNRCANRSSLLRAKTRKTPIGKEGGCVREADFPVSRRECSMAGPRYRFGVSRRGAAATPQ